MSQGVARPGRRRQPGAADDAPFAPFKSSASRRFEEDAAGSSPRRTHSNTERRAPFRLALELKRRIEAGIYAHGDWLPIEQALLFEFPVSRTVLREAIIILECQGLIVSHHGLGNRIATSQRFEEKAVIKSIDALGFLEACLFFETEAAALAAGLSKEMRLDEPTRRADGETLYSCHRFHISLAEAARNRLVSVSIKNLWDLALSQPAVGEVLRPAFERAAGSIIDLQARALQSLFRRGTGSRRPAPSQRSPEPQP